MTKVNAAMVGIAGGLMLIVLLGLFAVPLNPPPIAPPFNQTHATACRVLHAIAHTKRQRAEAMLACGHPLPDRWLGELNLATHDAAKR